jgi:hypothetical protein
MALTITADYAEGYTSVAVTVSADSLGTLRIERRADGSSVPDVLLSGATFIGEMTHIDRTAPYAVNMTYTAIHSVDGADSVVMLALPFPDDEGVCYMSVLSDPSEGALLQVATLQIYRPVSYAARNSVNDIIGQRFPVVLSGYRGSAAGTITLITHTHDQSARIRQILASGRTLIFRVPPAARPEAPSAAIEVSGVSEEPVILTDISRPERKWTLEFTEVAMPTIEDLAIVGGNSWSGVSACYDTWDDLTADPAADLWQMVRYSPAVADC